VLLASEFHQARFRKASFCYGHHLDGRFAHDDVEMPNVLDDVARAERAFETCSERPPHEVPLAICQEGVADAAEVAEGIVLAEQAGVPLETGVRPMLHLHILDVRNPHHSRPPFHHQQCQESQLPSVCRQDLEDVGHSDNLRQVG